MDLPVYGAVQPGIGSVGWQLKVQVLLYCGVLPRWFSYVMVRAVPSLITKPVLGDPWQSIHDRLITPLKNTTLNINISLFFLVIKHDHKENSYNTICHSNY